MPRKIKNVTKDFLVSVPLPVHGSTYTVISHQSIIDYAYAELANQGFGIVDEEYRCTLDGQIAQGIYKLQYNSDPEMSIMFAWTNSYNKQIKFKCATGAYVNVNNTIMLPGEIGAYTRKHTGTADVDTVTSMQTQITNAMMYYDQLVVDKDAMKSINLSTKRQAELLGVLFAEYEILNTEQASAIKQQMDKPSYFYNGGKNTLWAFYNHCTLALQQSHPRTWMEDQRMLHWIISNEFILSNPVSPVEEEVAVLDPLLVIPNQTNILDQIAEAEEITVEQAQYPVTPEGAFTNTAEVMEQAMKDELVFGVSGVAVSADGLRNVPIEEVLAVMKAEDSIPESIENKTVAIDIPEGTEIVEKEVLMSAEVVVMDLGDPESTPEPLQDYIERTAVEEADHIVVENEIWTTDEEPQKIATILDETVHYTDPAGNTFEAPVVEPESFGWEKPELEESTQVATSDFDFDFDLGSDDDEDNSSLPDFF